MDRIKKINSKYVVAIFAIILLLFTYCIINYSKLVAIYTFQEKIANKVENMEIVLGGEAVGIKLLASGVLVMSVDRTDEVNINIGDVILKVNDKKIETNRELAEYAKLSNGKDIKLSILRDNNIIDVTVKANKEDLTGEYKLGLWVKDSSAGVGTITFYDKKNLTFAGLGHGVTETKENYILPIETGGITETEILSIKKGESNNPGELRGTLSTVIMGSIRKNTDKGIYGRIYNENILNNKEKIEIMVKTQITEGKAIIYCTLDDNIVKSYDINIEKILINSTGNKNMVIKVTDEKLINKTGGIVQGMSGSPIVQNGKLVGAVTHVFLNDPTMGYGVFIENMIEDITSMEMYI